jgi:hypothetical protein
VYNKLGYIFVMSTTRRPHDDQNYWNVIFSLFFICVLFVALWGIYRKFNSFPRSIPILDAFLLAFAAFRITRLVVYDKITRFFREWFVDAKEISHEGRVWVELTPVGRGFRHTVYDLLTCPWCVGLWSGLIVSYCLLYVPVGMVRGPLFGCVRGRFTPAALCKWVGLAGREPQTQRLH